MDDHGDGAANKEWAQLTKQERYAVRLLGWAQQSWDSASDFSPFERAWAELSEAQRQAAQLLGLVEADFVAAPSQAQARGDTPTTQPCSSEVASGNVGANAVDGDGGGGDRLLQISADTVMPLGELRTDAAEAELSRLQVVQSSLAAAAAEPTLPPRRPQPLRSRWNCCIAATALRAAPPPPLSPREAEQEPLEEPLGPRLQAAAAAAVADDHHHRHDVQDDVKGRLIALILERELRCTAQPEPEPELVQGPEEGGRDRGEGGGQRWRGPKRQQVQGVGAGSSREGVVTACAHAAAHAGAVAQLDRRLRAARGQVAVTAAREAAVLLCAGAGAAASGRPGAGTAAAAAAADIEGNHGQRRRCWVAVDLMWDRVRPCTGEEQDEQQWGGGGGGGGWELELRCHTPEGCLSWRDKSLCGGAKAA
jgi:hypothetical protein